MNAELDTVYRRLDKLAFDLCEQGQTVTRIFCRDVNLPELWHYSDGRGRQFAALVMPGAGENSVQCADGTVHNLETQE